ncbi:MAG: Palmitoyltransferase [Claussenomyces sp. TS43310]|nr:MAG: Palmitoyltransferase [Claussenomyces sp. TS43310]
MDHHCPWTSNCVSHTTFPHFLRFVFYASLSLGALDYFLFTRAYDLYEQRNLPSYLGPSMYALVHLMLLLLITNLILFALTILLVTATHSLLLNTTMIEHWEIERHEALIERARRFGGYVYGPGGVRVRIKKQEFPYDIGMWENLTQGMGSSYPLAWFLPFAGGPDSESGWDFATNGFEDAGTQWPPVDPDRLPRRPIGAHGDIREATIYGEPDKEIEAFKKRQQADYRRWEPIGGQEIRQREIDRSYDMNRETDGTCDESEESESESEYEEGIDGKPGWTSSDGSRLRDFGVDEEADLTEDDEDNIPLGELLRRRRQATIREED